MVDTNEFLDAGLNKREFKLVRASTGKRFTNYIIDRLVNTGLLFLIIMGLMVIMPAFESWLNNINTIVDYLFTSVILVALYFGMELLTNGKTIGKYITKTRVVTESGGQPTQSQYFTRSLSRVVPFEAFSFLNDEASGWHDKWSETMVIDEGESNW